MVEKLMRECSGDRNLKVVVESEQNGKRVDDDDDDDSVQSEINGWISSGRSDPLNVTYGLS
ncbi:hypothetical protein TSUD_235390 [Trifolium subterraneum]|nr:hypothetical protein TSUD_235390 [Trifolium subterraneum]